MEKIYQELKKTFKERIKKDYPLSEFTTFKTGGKAKIIVFPENIDEVKKILKISSEYGIKTVFLGNGSNVLISDDGIDGIVIITSLMKNIGIENGYIFAECGVKISSLLKFLILNKKGGLEFLAGIPGTVGGATFTNSGLKKEWISKRIKKVDVLDKEGNILSLKDSSLKFSYRKSNLEGYFIWKVYLELMKKNEEKIKEEIKKFIIMRKKKQPIGERCAGSVFKNLENGIFAGKIIENCGLKGYRIGGAKVSEKHANFIINTGNATSSQIYSLIKLIQKIVKEKYNIELETEIKLIGKF